MHELANQILDHAERLLLPLFEDTEQSGVELIARNPRRQDSTLGSFRINLVTGKWADFALDNVKGTNPISFISYVKDWSYDQAQVWAQKELTVLGFNEAQTGNEAHGNGRETDAQDVSETVLPVPAGILPLAVPDRVGYPENEWCYRDAKGLRLCIIRRYREGESKKIICWTYCAAGHWAPKKPPKPWPLYNLDRLAMLPEAVVLLAEGEKAADAATLLLDGVGTTVLNGCNGVKDAELSPLEGRNVVILPDADEPGRKYAKALVSCLQGNVSSLHIVDVWALGWKDGEDIADQEDIADCNGLCASWLKDHAICADTWFDANTSEQEQELKRTEEKVAELAQLNPMAYELRRTQEAEALGVRTSALDTWVMQKREGFSPTDNVAGQALVLEDPEAWPEAVDGQALAQAIRDTFTRHIVLPPGAAEALTLWVFHTHAFAAADYTPHLVLVSAVKRSGKTTTLRVLEELCSKSLKVEHATTSAIFRCVEHSQPTILLDEADSFIGDNELLRGLLNSSFERGGGVLRVEGEDREPRRFCTFTPTALASIKDLPGTLMDRAIVIRMKRKAAAENIEKFRRSNRAACHDLKRKFRRWAEDNLNTLAEAECRLPESLNDREMDFWEPLFQVAARLGPEWEDTAYQTALTLQGQEAHHDKADWGLELLSDIRSLVLPLKAEKFTSEWLRCELGALEGKPWATFTDRGLISQLDIARQLRPFGIKPQKIRIDAQTAKRPEQNQETYQGYRLSWFYDTWERYLPELSTENRKQTTPSPNSPVEAGTGGTPGTSGTKAVAANVPPVPGVPDVPGLSGRERVNTPCSVTGMGPDVSDVPVVPGVPGLTGLKELNILCPITGTKIPVLYLTDPQAAEARLREMARFGKVLGMDTETRPKPGHERDKKAGLSPVTGQLRLVQVSDGQKVLVLDMAHMTIEVITLLGESRIVFHNAQFDLAFLVAAGVQLRETSCTQLMIAALTHQPMVSLAQACQEYLDVEVDKALQVSDWTSAHLFAEQVEYAARDALLTLALYKILLEQLKSNGLMAGFKLVRRCIPAIADAQARGVLLDIDAHRALVSRWQQDREVTLNKLQRILGPNLNPESGKQLSIWLNENLEQEVRASWPLTEKGQLCTNKDTLEVFSQVKLVQPLLEYRRVAHRLKTWGETYERHLGPDSRLHPNFVLLGARSGRMSCRHPNIQNLPRDPAVRACFIAPEGYKLVAADFAQIELRIAGLLSRDPVILSAYEQGRDLHRAIVAQVTGKADDEITSTERKLGKALNFGLLYGASAGTFQTRARVDYGLDIPLDKAERFKSIFDQTYSRLRWWQLEQQREAQTKGKIRTVGGRLVSFQNPARCYTDSRNYPIQAAAADLQLLAIQRIYARLVERGRPTFLVNFVHDELVLEVQEDQVDEVSSLLLDEMAGAFLELFNPYNPEPVARGLVEVGAGYNYSQAK